MNSKKVTALTLGMALVLLSLVLLSAVSAQAVNIKFGGQMRPRYNFVDHKNTTGFNSTFSPEHVWSTRIRLGVKVKLDDKNSGFFQVQGIGIWGLKDNRSSIGPSDTIFDAGFHQAYFTVNQFYDLPLDFQIGRQEVVLDGHRLIGNVGWFQGGRSHDSVRLTYSVEDFTFLYVFSQSQEFDNSGSFAGIAIGSSTVDPSDKLDTVTHIIWGNAKDLLGEHSSTSIYAIYVNASDVNPDLVGPPPVIVDKVHNDIYTTGLRQEGRLFGLDYRGEFYYQFGQAEQTELLDDLGTPVARGMDREAYMYGLRLGKRFNKVPWKPSLTLWYDFLSGTDWNDITNNKFSTFATLFATQHKFYGSMDLYQVSGVLGDGRTTNQLGLRDLAVKTSVQPMDKFLIQADFHQFWTDTDLSDPDNAPLAAAMGWCTCDTNLGQELDITLVHRYNNYLTISAGYSRYFATL
ncbi:MAG: alginate export family protein, partial [candidate division Zixibacteria bacterium]|nr:alginate export family protein [candidate division Zixibacteria bacterium]